MRNRLLSLVLCGAMICATVPMGGCSSSQFDTVLNEIGPATLTILQIIALVKGVPVNSSLSTKVAADAAAAEKLYNDFTSTADANSKAGIAAEINAEFATLNSDLGSVFVLAQVSDVNTQAKLTALIGLIQSAVQIAEAAIPTSAAKAVKPLSLSPSGLVDSWNKIVVAKTGNAKVDAATPGMKLHIHGRFVRLATAGVLN